MPGRDHPTFTRRDVLRRVEAETGEVADRPNLPARLDPLGAVRGVFYEEDASGAREHLERRHVGGTPGVVHRHDRAGARREGALHRLRIQVARDRIDISKDRRRADVHDRVRGCTECQRGRDHLVAGRDAGCDQGQVEGRRAGAQGQGVGGAGIGGEVALELFDPRSGRQPARFERRADLLELRRTEVRRSKGDGRSRRQRSHAPPWCNRNATG